MIEKIKTIYKSPITKQLTDVRSIGLIIFGIIVLSVSWSSAKIIQQNYDLQKKISQLQQENDIASLQNENDKLRNKYLETDQFLELAARRQFGLAAPGEKVIIVPKNVALANTVDMSSKTSSNQSALPKKPSYQANFDAWMDFFLHR